MPETPQAAQGAGASLGLALPHCTLAFLDGHVHYLRPSPEALELLPELEEGSLQSVWSDSAYQKLVDGLKRCLEQQSRLVVDVEHDLGVVRHELVPLHTDGHALALLSRNDAAPPNGSDELAHLARHVAHDLNNLLTVINGYAELLERGLGPHAALGGQLDHIRMAGERGVDLARQLLAFSQNLILSPANLALEELLDECISLLPSHAAHRIHLDCPEGARIFGDHDTLCRALADVLTVATGLLRGAARFLLTVEPAGPETSNTVELRLHAPKSMLLPGTLKSLFQPYALGKDNGVGRGLDLAAAYGVVCQHGGGIWVSCAAGEGTLWRITLPGPENQTTTVGPGQVMGTEADSPSSTLLLVDDEELVRELMSETLRQRGYRVLEASSAREAIELSIRFSGEVDMLVTDISMPGDDGFRLAKQLREQRPGVRVLFLSGFFSEPALAARPGEAAPEFLQKPFLPEALLDKVSSMLAGAPPNDEVTLLVVDDDAQVRTLARSFLEEAGYLVVEAGDGTEALRMLGAVACDAVICDLVMPEKEGIETFREIKQTFPSTRFIAMSGAACRETYFEIVSLLGARGNLYKPFSKEELLTLVRKVLDDS